MTFHFPCAGNLGAAGSGTTVGDAASAVGLALARAAGAAAVCAGFAGSDGVGGNLDGVRLDVLSDLGVAGARLSSPLSLGLLKDLLKGLGDLTSALDASSVFNHLLLVGSAVLLLERSLVFVPNRVAHALLGEASSVGGASAAAAGTSGSISAGINGGKISRSLNGCVDRRRPVLGHRDGRHKHDAQSL